MNNRWYSFFKYVLLGPVLRLYNRPTIEGSERIPATGSAILASNHQAVMDSFYLPLLCPRQITFPAKSEYFTSTGFVGRMQKWFFSAVGQIPLDRTATNAGEALMNAAKEVLERGDLFGIYPEGTRSPDGRVYKGKTGMARVALETDELLIPVAMIGTRNANPIGSWWLRPAKVAVRIGEPISPRSFVKELGMQHTDPVAIRALTDHVMRELARLTGEEYVDIYASEVKKQLTENKGHPDTTTSK
ncbi:1-acyl-sn-glycerol-3-phosphate acetyltransferase [Corynebacterium kutscheri]|uniref:lysophospholipid acyltransferase family protein n=1 Tax=Corynebacterium kutscheri TaxID=35755 RepID=UPI000F6DFF78|nr:lysophospholipid acyltransferase family protein [Corynebacterium kutscheri]VEH79989.1 1-acyl-sn-glycerol-3-phosphate acetyltransferase [Corynebacterium kutscheri]